MYEELIKRLRDSEHEIDCSLCDRDCCYPGGKVHGKCIIIEAVDAIEELSRLHEAQRQNLITLMNEEPEPKWIPVTERLPETPGEYMVAYHPCYWDRVHDEIKVGLDSFRGKTSWAKKKYKRVTHWMPLPKPPKEET